MTREVVVVAGAVAQRPGRGGHAWVFLQYLLGFRQLGCDVVFVDRLSPDMLGEDAAWPPGDDHPSVRWLRDVLEPHGLGDAFALLLEDGSGATVGLSRERLRERLRGALLFNVMGYLDDPSLLELAARRVFVDIDPGFPQMWRDLGLHDAFAGHDAHVTVGLRVGEPGCAVPDCGIDWVRMLQPVVLDAWPVRRGGERYTSVGSWRGPFAPIERGGQRYGLRAHQLRGFADLPARTGDRLELALDIDPADEADERRLRDGGWHLVSPHAAAGTADAYRDYIATSRGELGVAKDMYVRARSGWFSDRSACYLASGKPVIAQATGFEEVCPTGEGLLTFSTPDEAAAAVDEVEARYERHCDAARALAEEHFDARKVLSRVAEAVA